MSRPKLASVHDICSLSSFLDGVFDHRAYTERALAKLVKAKGKADRAAARAAAGGSTVSGTTTPAPVVQPPSAAATPVSAHEDSPAEASSSTTNPPADESQESQPTDMVIGDALPIVEKEKEKEKDKLATRIEVLKEKSDLVQRFLNSLVPILVDVYAASVAIQVRTRTLSGLLKAVSWMEADALSTVLKVRSSTRWDSLLVVNRLFGLRTFLWPVLSAPSYHQRTTRLLSLERYNSSTCSWASYQLNTDRYSVARACCMKSTFEQVKI